MKAFIKHQWSKLNDQQKSVAFIVAAVVLIIIVIS